MLLGLPHPFMIEDCGAGVLLEVAMFEMRLADLTSRASKLALQHQPALLCHLIKPGLISLRRIRARMQSPPRILKAFLYVAPWHAAHQGGKPQLHIL